MGRVYVIGAGCPRGAGIDAPLAREVFAWAIRNNRKFPDFTGGEVRVLRSVGVNVDLMKGDQPPFEEVLARLSRFIRSNPSNHG